MASRHDQLIYCPLSSTSSLELLKAHPLTITTEGTPPTSRAARASSPRHTLRGLHVAIMELR